MRKGIASLLLCSLLIGAAFGVSQNVIYLKGTRIDTSTTQGLDLSHSSLTATNGPALEQFLVQLKGPITPELKASVEAKLGQPLGPYLPVNTFLVIAPRSALASLKDHEGVQWVGPHLPHYKISNTVSFMTKKSQSERSEVEKEILGSTDFDVNEINKALKNVDLNALLSPSSSAKVADPSRKSIVAIFPVDMNTNQLSSFVQEWQRSLGDLASETVVRALSPRKIRVTTKTEVLEKAAEFVSQQPLVHWIEAAPVFTTKNMHARQVLHTDVTETHDKPPAKLVSFFDEVGLDGSGEIIGVGDTGLDFTSCWFHDSAEVPMVKSDSAIPNSSHRKVAGYWAFIDQEDFVDGHGTHVSGSIAGQWSKGDNGLIPAYHGTAPAAKLAVTDVGCSNPEGCQCSIDDEAGCPCPASEGGCPYDERATFVPTDLNKYFFPWAYKMGARIHSNSWGGEAMQDHPGADYDANAHEVDTFTFEHKDFLPVFAAGNDGASGFYTIGSPGTAKNALTVGASRNTFAGLVESVKYKNMEEYAHLVSKKLQNQFCTCQAGCDDKNSACKLAHMLTSEEVCCNIADKVPELANIGPMCCRKYAQKAVESDPGYANHLSVAAFSSRGPSTDGRIKPDIVSPGDVIISAKSHGNKKETTCGVDAKYDQEPTKQLLSMSGTSMATPLTSGTVALIRQYFREGFYPTGSRMASNGFSPSAALLKATVINGAIALYGRSKDHGVHSIDYLPVTDSAQRTPSFLQGFGRVALNNSLPLAGKGRAFKLFVHDSKDDEGLALNQVDRYCLKVSKPNTNLRTTLVWTDAAALPSSELVLVNDLDLSVTSVPTEGNTLTLLGNGRVTQDGEGHLYLQEDRLNNVERVNLYSARPGKYVIEVKAFRIAVGKKQPYALVVTGDFDATPSPCTEEEVAGAAAPSHGAGPHESHAGRHGSHFHMIAAGVALVVAGVVAGVAVATFVNKRRLRAVSEGTNVAFQPLQEQ